MIIEDSFLQRSEQWREAKAGIPGASNFNKIVTSKGAPSKQAKDYIYQLAGEKILGRIEETYTSFAMQQGIDREDEARLLYELITGKQVHQVALVYKNDSKSVSCSPDGLLDAQRLKDQKGLEIKCPLLKTHVKYLLDNTTLIKEYFIQVQGSMWVCDFNTYDLMSYVPGMPDLILTVKRDNEFIAALETEMIKFLRELEKVYDRLGGEK